jgi:glutaredoxin
MDGLKTTPDPLVCAMHAVVYTRLGCHLCEDAKQVLLRHGLTVEEVDIDRDAGLHARYDECVPVVEIDGKERFRGRVDERLLRRLLAARP